MPDFWTVALNSGVSGGDPAKLALVDQRPRLLMRATKEGVGRAAHRQPLGFRKRPQGFALFQRQHQRLFGIGVFARFQYPFGDRIMRVGDGHVDDHVNVGIGQKIVNRLRAGVEFCRPRGGHGHVHIRHRAHFQTLEQRRKPQIRGRDIAASDDADP